MPKNVSRLIALVLAVALLTADMPVYAEPTSIVSAPTGSFQTQALSEALSFFFHVGSINVRAAVLVVGSLMFLIPGARAQSQTLPPVQKETLQVTIRTITVEENVQNAIEALKTDGSNKNVYAAANPAGIPALIQLLGDPHETLEARIHATYALRLLHDPRVTTALGAALKDPDAGVRGQALLAIQQLKDPASFEAVLQTALNDADEIVQRSAIDVLGVLGNRRAVPPLLRIFPKSTGFLRLVIIRALGDLKDPSAFEPLLNALASHPDVPQITSLIDALVQFQDRRAILPIALTAFASDNQGLRTTAAFGLSKILGTNNIVAGLIQELKSRSFLQSSESALLRRLQAARRYGLDFPLRFKPAVLDAILDARAHPKSDGRRLVIAVFPKKDRVGAFYSTDFMEQLLKKGYKLMVFEAGSRRAVIDSIKQGSRSQKARLIILAAHSDESSMGFGTDDPADGMVPPEMRPYELGLWDEQELSRSVSHALEEGGQVIVDGCSTGKGGSGTQNIVNMLRRVFPWAKAIWGPVRPAGIGKFIFDDQKDVSNVDYGMPNDAYRAGNETASPSQGESQPITRISYSAVQGHPALLARAARLVADRLGSKVRLIATKSLIQVGNIFTFRFEADGKSFVVAFDEIKQQFAMAGKWIAEKYASSQTSVDIVLDNGTRLDPEMARDLIRWADAMNKTLPEDRKIRTIMLQRPQPNLPVFSEHYLRLSRDLVPQLSSDGRATSALSKQLQQFVMGGDWKPVQELPIMQSPYGPAEWNPTAAEINAAINAPSNKTQLVNHEQAFEMIHALGREIHWISPDYEHGISDFVSEALDQLAVKMHENPTVQIHLRDRPGPYTLPNGRTQRSFGLRDDQGHIHIYLSSDEKAEGNLSMDAQTLEGLFHEGLEMLLYHDKAYHHALPAVLESLFEKGWKVDHRQKAYVPSGISPRFQDQLSRMSLPELSAFIQEYTGTNLSRQIFNQFLELLETPIVEAFVNRTAARMHEAAKRRKLELETVAKDPIHIGAHFAPEMVEAPLECEREVSPYEKAYSFADRSYVVWAEGPRMGQLYRIVEKPSLERLNVLPKMATIEQEFDRRLTRINELNTQAKGKPYRSNESFEFYDRAKKETAAMYLWLQQLHDGNAVQAGLAEAQLFDLQGEGARYHTFLQEIQDKGLHRFAMDRADSLGLPNTLISSGGFNGEEVDAFSLYFYEKKASGYNFYQSPGEPLIADHYTGSQAIVNVLQLRGLASKKYFESYGIKKRFGGASGSTLAFDPEAVSFWVRPSPDGKLAVGHFGQTTRLEYPVIFAMKLSSAEQLAWRPGEMQDEQKIPDFVPIERITHIFAPYFRLGELRALFHAHGIDHIQFLPLGFNEEGQPLHPLLNQSMSVESDPLPLHQNSLIHLLDNSQFRQSVVEAIDQTSAQWAEYFFDIQDGGAPGVLRTGDFNQDFFNQKMSRKKLFRTHRVMDDSLFFYPYPGETDIHSDGDIDRMIGFGMKGAGYFVLIYHPRKASLRGIHQGTSAEDFQSEFARLTRSGVLSYYQLETSESSSEITIHPLTPDQAWEAIRTFLNFPRMEGAKKARAEYYRGQSLAQLKEVEKNIRERLADIDELRSVARGDRMNEDSPIFSGIKDEERMKILDLQILTGVIAEKNQPAHKPSIPPAVKEAA